MINNTGRATERERCKTGTRENRVGDSCDIYDQDMRCVLVMRSALVDGVSVKYGLIYNGDFPLPGFVCCATHLKLSGSINCLLGVSAKGRVSPLTSRVTVNWWGNINQARCVEFFRGDRPLLN